MPWKTYFGRPASKSADIPGVRAALSQKVAHLDWKRWLADQSEANQKVVVYLVLDGVTTQGSPFLRDSR